MKEIERYDINEAWAHSGIIKAGDFCFLNYCVRNVDGAIEQQINGAFDEMEERLALVGMTLENVVQMNCLFKNMVLVKKYVGLAECPDFGTPKVVSYDYLMNFEVIII